ncbi:MAG: hypothetical protein A2312_03580 [Candidatus Staskawiczbacteria bacterium RIFOXYB2_FULL_32_9]|uniref:Uncharacterized protein n=1 Tax=Candidatus Staskawiczbacteria bacterium RIFOXYD1_FULL_32_13 TaxID=1802234 RepID=A0A1G2JR39_9BACT|nr:MAG: hypothetical protein A2360_00090 [Candidatus Staskawiczbacteria bacterium RIFOXYB1_FULL_32_11]OGZ78321.1 MAG: hypothetical protein A2256_01640 [Candidatus Staskawiczbacteria bacterium RIFOXYA2_FULL_32_7]OGZ82537.1 MAG: hypothetical protein A2312_03580 [Candidatus Staskawiczbacteria bacterium RIFOXYB2_FULL_32_9]OGZ87783.1 MAG: hypothetical protein A2463_02615 [Candidatus Staskawiczbacteria bacterium RIFOXYC2_FULL_32_10]OGZ89609.1 MAG: hypothetical protein A2561_03695 [Candidatus Staskawi
MACDSRAKTLDELSWGRKSHEGTETGRAGSGRRRTPIRKLLRVAGVAHHERVRFSERNRDSWACDTDSRHRGVAEARSSLHVMRRCSVPWATSELAALLFFTKIIY